jgi:hypothetical protein
MTEAKRRKLIADYIRARDDYRRSLGKMRKDREEFIRLGLIPADENDSDT